MLIQNGDAWFRREISWRNCRSGCHLTSL